MAVNCCCSSSFAATTAIYAAARAPNTFTITLRRRNAFSQSIRNPINQIAPSNFLARSKAMESEYKTDSDEIDCIGTGLDVECVISEESEQGTVMVAMKEVLPKTGPFVVAAFRLIPSGLLLIAFAASGGRALPSGFNAWLSISAFTAKDSESWVIRFGEKESLMRRNVVDNFRWHKIDKINGFGKGIIPEPLMEEGLS
ncbi:hypothetical protein SASPL_137945 [Salvia splendens]|uniref:Uncharacterized protein n=1 Tax=Salvia splendens TaxID=180675 RepID=A0A8X8WSL9_SALSN|nr:hypothetical protein SASPL_137945 [Salvia splendens]